MCDILHVDSFSVMPVWRGARICAKTKYSINLGIGMCHEKIQTEKNDRNVSRTERDSLSALCTEEDMTEIKGLQL